MIETWQTLARSHPMTATLVALLALLLLAWLAAQVSRLVILRAFRRLANSTQGPFDDALLDHQAPHRLALIVPAASIQFGSARIPYLHGVVAPWEHNVPFPSPLP